MRHSCCCRFLGSPRISCLDELRLHNLFLSDFPTHDMGADFVLLAEERKAEADQKEKYEASPYLGIHDNT